MKRVLIITYYWPPMGGSGVQRWLKFAKYLPSFGWEPIVYTPENPSFQLHDESLLGDVSSEQIVWKHPIWEPHHLFYRAKGKKNLAQVNQGDILDKKNQSLFEKLGLWVRGNLLIPDPRRFWISPSVKYLMRRLANERIDAIVTTGPPHSLHHIGRLLHQRTGIPWLADFRDPWTRWVFLRSFRVSAGAMRVHRRQEKQILQSAQAVTTVSQALREDFEELGGRPVHELTNGYDEADFATTKAPPPQQFLISYIGTLDYLRDPRTFLRALRALCSERADFAEHVHIRFVGYLSGVILKDIENDAVLADKLTIAHYVPHEVVLRLLQNAYVHLLLLSSGPETRGILTGKFFEYLASGKRILALGRKGSEIDQILQTTRAGVLHDPQDTNGIKATLLRYFEDYKTNASLNTIGVEQYSRRNLTEALSKILDSMTHA